MNQKTKSCTQGARHKWQFVKNTTNAQAGGRGIPCPNCNKDTR